VARQRRRWRQHHPELALTWSINLSARQFDRPGLAERIRDAITAGDPDPADPDQPLRGFEFEITEGAMMRDPVRAEAELSRLRTWGAHVAIDDFGTGYSSLAYLKHLPIDRLKIDRAFVRDLDRDSDDAAIVAAAITMARQLGRQSVAEGVETPAQLRALHTLGCDAVQGFGLARPMPALHAWAYVQQCAGGMHADLWGTVDQASSAANDAA
jgi:EAL domain-containing protein (putative c-di-GMP-specific phosphodiesterase class I)